MSPCPPTSIDLLCARAEIPVHMLFFLFFVIFILLFGRPLHSSAHAHTLAR